MVHSIFLALQYLKYRWGKTILLILAISLVLFIPMGLNILTNQGSEKLTRRAMDTPLLIGSLGSQTELVLSTLYFKEPKISSFSYKKVNDLKNTNLAHVIPVHMRYQVRDYRIIGTSSDYFTFRQLKLESGRVMTMLGECILGATVAKKLNKSVGDFVISSPAGAFDVAGSYPLKMKITGILEPSQTKDDEVVFTDIKTSWVISGLAHGHQDVKVVTNDSLLLSKTNSNAVVSPALLSYTEITADNIDSFHFHGNPESFPVDAMIAIPKDKKSGLMLRGRFETNPSDLQILVPKLIIDNLINTVVSVKNIVILTAIIIGFATTIILILVFALSIQLRHQEIKTLRYIGAEKRRINQILGIEILLTLILGLLLAVILSFSLKYFGLNLIDNFIS